jgi:hypothetical protein
VVLVRRVGEQRGDRPREPARSSPTPYSAITVGSPDAVNQPSGKVFANQTTPRTLTAVPR